MYKYLLAAIGLLFSSNVFASPNQINVIGLVPGVSSKVQVEAAKADYGYIIGGYELICVPKYNKGVLLQLACFTGKEYNSKDTTKESHTLASNIEVHTVLVKGFTKKFGSPVKVENESLQNAYGTEFISNMVEWKDKKGNVLTLVSRMGKMGNGVLLLQSAKKILSNEKSKAKAERKRSF